MQETLNIKIDENPNFLNQFHSYTYQWRLFMVNELSLKKNDFNVLKAPQLTIAETGSTSIYIDSVSIDSSVCTSSETLSATRMVFNVELVEPNSAEFFDLIYSASLELQIQNWAKTPFYLQLTFRGYDEDGEPQYIEGNPTWVWRMQVNQMENTIDEGGARYSLQGYLLNDIALAQDYGTVPKALSITGNTFLEMMANLETEWNKYEAKNARLSASALVQYKFLFYQDKVSPANIKLDWHEMKMVESFDSQNPSRTRTANTNETGTGTGANKHRAAFANGWRIQRVIDTLISSSSFAEKLRNEYPTLLDTKSDTGKLANLGVAKTYLMEPQVIYTAYDPIANDYEKLIVYHIWPYDGITPVLDATPAAGSATVVDKEIEEKKNQRAKSGILYLEEARSVRKVYNYYYTGKNTDVLKFDLRFNTFWRAFIFQYGANQLRIKGPVVDNSLLKDTATSSLAGNIVQQQEASQLRAEADKLRNEASVTGIDASIASENIRKANFLEQRANRLASQVEQYRANSRQVAENNLLTLNSSSRYAEDLPTNNQGPTPAIIPITVDESDTVSTTAEGKGIEEHYFEGRNFFGSLLNQMYNTRIPEWLKIEMEIRGDPHWFGFNHLTRFKDLFKNVQNTGGLNDSGGRVTVNPVDDPASLVVNIDKLPPDLRAHVEGLQKAEPNDSPRFELGQQGFLINFFTPGIFRDTDEFTDRTNDQGFRVPKKSAFISGLYMVFNVNHKFENGLFTQELIARRDPHTANYTLQEYAANRQIIKNERKQLPSSTSSNNITREVVPDKKLNQCNNSLACRNNNPGNIQYGTNGYFGAIGENAGFGVYETPEDGAQAMATQLDRYVTGKTTGTPLETTNDIISTWAPPGHGNNNPTAYANTVAAKVGVSPTDNIANRLKTDTNFKARFMSAMADVEAGNGHGYTPEFMKSAINIKR